MTLWHISSDLPSSPRLPTQPLARMPAQVAACKPFHCCAASGNTLNRTSDLVESVRALCRFDYRVHPGKVCYASTTPCTCAVTHPLMLSNILAALLIVMDWMTFVAYRLALLTPSSCTASSGLGVSTCLLSLRSLHEHHVGVRIDQMLKCAALQLATLACRRHESYSALLTACICTCRRARTSLERASDPQLAALAFDAARCALLPCSAPLQFSIGSSHGHIYDFLDISPATFDL